MYFERNVVQESIKSFFTRAIENDRLAHAYLFYGPEGSGKDAFALELAKALNCGDMFGQPCDNCPACNKINRMNHPDVKMLFPLARKEREDDKKLLPLLKEKAANPYRHPAIAGHLIIAIEQIRQLKDESKYAPFEAKKRVFIVSDAGRMTREAANSFLKLLEEPPKDLLLILTSSDAQSIMDTIRSRCQPLRFPPFNAQQIKEIVQRFEVEADEQSLTAAIRLSRHNLRLVFDKLDSDAPDYRPAALSFLRDIAQGKWADVNLLVDDLGRGRDKNKVLEFLETTTFWLRDAFYYQNGAEAGELLNGDDAGPIEKFCQRFPLLDYPRLLDVLQECQRDIAANGHVAMNLTNLALEVGRQLKQGQQHTKSA